jgi:hypothetical protein
VNEGVCEELHSPHAGFHVIDLVMHAYVQVIVGTTVGLGTTSYKACDEEYQT